MGEPDSKDPIYSTRADDPSVSDAIRAFVVALARRIDDLQDAEAAGDGCGVASRARDLAAESDRLGFDLLSDSSGCLASACGADDRDAIHKAVVEITDIAQRVRQGHRGAA